MNDRDVYAKLRDALRTRLDVIQDQSLRQSDSQAHLRALQHASEQIIAIQQELPRETPPRLIHFLERCSYDKALAWLEQQPG